MTKLFLDANVLVSAAYSDSGRLVELWSFPDELCSSPYAVEEAHRNLRLPERHARLDRLLTAMSIASGLAPLPAGIVLVEKDRPILQAAIYASATHLLTGDKRHFRHLDGQRVEGVLIQRPGDYLRLRRPPKSS